MADHFVMLVDHLLTESTLEVAIKSKNTFNQTTPFLADDVTNLTSYPEYCSSPRTMVECRICQDEDFDSNMETPCSCCGSLKYAHRKCVQRWCNEKGDTVCEICHQQFKPGYTAPPPIFRLGGLPTNLRGNWRIARRDLNNHQIVEMVSTDSSFLDPDHDEYAVPTSRSIVCCRSVAITFMFLLILRHTLPVLASRAENYSFPLIMLMVLRVVGIMLPICVILKTVASISSRRRQLQANSLISPSDEEAIGMR